MWDFLICIFDSYSIRAILGWGVVDCVGAITIVLHTNWLHSTWKSDNMEMMTYRQLADLCQLSVGKLNGFSQLNRMYLYLMGHRV